MSNMAATIRKNIASRNLNNITKQQTSPANRQIHCTVQKTQGMTPGDVHPTTRVGEGVGAGVQLFAEGVQLLGRFSVAYAIRGSLDAVCLKVDSRRMLDNGGVLLTLNVEVSQIVAEPAFPPPPVVKGAYICGYPPNPYEEVKGRLTSSSLVDGRHRDVNLEIYYIWVTPQLFVERQYQNWPVLAKQVIDLSGPSLLQKAIGPVCRQIDQMITEWNRKRAEEDARKKAQQPPPPPRPKPAQSSTGGDVHTYNK